MKRRPVITFAAMLLCFCPIAGAQITFTNTSNADTFLATGSPINPAGSDLTGLNFGASGALVIAPAASPKGEFQSILKFNLSGATNLFNTTYGTNNWTLTGLSLELASNFGSSNVQPDNLIYPVINGGKFVVEWLSEDDWVEGTGRPNQPATDGVTCDSIPDLLTNAHAILCTNTYSPPGNNVHVPYPLPLNSNLIADVMGGGDVSFLFYAADDQIGYLFNAHTFPGNEPLIHVTASRLLKILSGYFTNTTFHLTGLGTANLPYQIQVTTNLSSPGWQMLDTITADNAGVIQFDDSAATDQPRRFYRLFRGTSTAKN